ncbi:hypothetical protein SLE2022_192960 [Rubroshorea leprosula]|uniref:HMA domain-containing protein n=1 Tax=Rubroshorea leprosula TaxID=152421 RepID=A0AAV5J7B4_9ROSI|nr:hypothetical protein SLEP1_g20198 [Rubroshorea leprosula]
MATLSPFLTPLYSISRTSVYKLRISCSQYSVRFQNKNNGAVPFRNLALSTQKRQRFCGMRRLSSVEEDSLVPEPESDSNGGEQVQAAESAAQEETVSVPVSPSDKLTMYFQADGTLAESEIPRVTKALEESEGVSNLKVQVIEGIGTVELTKQTTVQATGVASSLVEIIQGAGFKLQTLNLSFDDEEDILV